MLPVDIKPVALRRLFPQAVRAIQVGADQLIIDRAAGKITVDLHTVQITSEDAWRLLARVTLETSSGTFHLDGVTHEAVSILLEATLRGKRRETLRAALREGATGIARALAAWDQLCARDAYLTDREARAWLETVGQLPRSGEGEADLIEQLPGERLAWAYLGGAARLGGNLMAEVNRPYTLKRAVPPVGRTWLEPAR